jgi:hypothetical protein
MDPLGFSLENFSAVAQYRADDPDTKTPIDTSGVLPNGKKIDGPADLRNALTARSTEFLEAFTENLLTFALGRQLDYRDMPTVRAIVRDAAEDNYTFESIVRGIVSSDQFRKREVEGFTQDPKESNDRQGLKQASLQ